ncbi:hypothetical protein GKC30_02895 [Pseudodesulfovibrio sp. F-1]|uniref:Uncharacterized protein n=1 Tax=Pseudodesulfovibrio alkaliphilus TaxID=2661613 RepID=A0A7K1KKH6_9BACT|nr:hypothetical protein [Pseudodesulfovibrio alkaliphilus]MUM76578.1 hypothetical protein [Pseudodesulfovibrio alkaliphilus]
MDKQLEDAIRTLAEGHGVNPEVLLAGFASVDMPPELARTVAAVLDGIDGFSDSCEPEPADD